MRWPTIAGIGIFLFIAGFFLLPAGYDIILYGFLRLTGDNYFEATLLMYATSIGLMFTGFALAGRRVNIGPLNVLKSPIFVVIILLIVVAVFFIIIRT